MSGLPPRASSPPASGARAGTTGTERRGSTSQYVDTDVQGIIAEAPPISGRPTPTSDARRSPTSFEAPVRRRSSFDLYAQPQEKEVLAPAAPLPWKARKFSVEGGDAAVTLPEAMSPLVTAPTAQ